MKQAARDNPRPLAEQGANQHTIKDRGEDVTNSKNVTTSSKSQINPKPEPQRGNHSAYRIKKLRRDHPEIAEAVERGEYKSVAAAERAAKGEDPNPPRKQQTILEKIQSLWMHPR